MKLFKNFINRCIHQYYNKRVIILILTILLVHIILKNFLNINIFDLKVGSLFGVREGLFSGGTTGNSFGGGLKLPCVKFPKDPEGDIEGSTDYLVSKFARTIYDLDNILGKYIKKDEKLFEGKFEEYFLKIKDSCEKIEVDKKKYTYAELREGKNITPNEKKILEKRKKEENKINDELTPDENKFLDEKIANIQKNFNKFIDRLVKHQSKKDKGHLSDKKIDILVKTVFKKEPLPAISLLMSYYKRIMYKSKKERWPRNMIIFQKRLLTGIEKFSEKLLKTKLYKLTK